jgi:hypothetical protein
MTIHHDELPSRRTRRGSCRRRDGLIQKVEPLFLKSDPPSGDNGNGSKSEGEGFSTLITEGEIEEDGIRSIIIVSGEGDLFHAGKRDLQIDCFTPFPSGHLKVKNIPFDP